MAENDVSSEVLRPTGLTPAEPPPEQLEDAAAPPDEGVARTEDEPAGSEDVALATDQAPDAHTNKPNKPARGVQKALDRLRAEAEQERRAGELQRARADLAESHLRNIAWQNQQKQVQPTEKPPEMKDFSDWGEFNRATARYEAKQEARQIVQNQFRDLAVGIAQHQNQSVQQQQRYDIDSRIAQASQKGSEKIPDWDDVVVTSDLPVTDALKYVIAQADDPAIAMHYLATHPNEHMKLVQMDPMRMAMTAGKMFSANPSISRAPAPARPIGARSTGPTGYRDDFTPAQHKAWLAKQAR